MSGEKRSQDREDTPLEETTIIVDIEGTTSSISFVKETLFPYVKENLKQYIEKNWELEEFKGVLAKLKEQAKKDETENVEGVVSITGATPEEERESVIKNVLWQMDGDRKTGALKQLQGHVWREAYESGAVKGQVYEDVPKAFDSWTKSGKKIYVYSSGSVEAQKLLFRHSEHGDMSKYLSDYFDTEVGPKREASSYKSIVRKIGAEPSSVLFLTDIVKEARAAKEAGISANIVLRQGNAPLTDEEKVNFKTIESFADLSFQTPAKRQKVEKTEDKEAAKPEPATSEPMDTSDDAEVSSVEKGSAERTEESKKAVELEEIETETKAAEKSQVSRMDVESKTEPDIKSAAVTESVAITEETRKTEEESKANENKEEIGKRAVVSEVVEKESEATKEKAKVTKDAGEESRKESEAKKTEVDRVDGERKDEGKSVLPYKSEPIATITEEKTEVSTNASESAETKKETEAKASVSAPEEKPKEAENEMSGVPNESPNAPVETKVEEKAVETKAEKVEPVVTQDAKEKTASKVDEKSAAAGVKQNGDSAPSKAEEVSASKSELNGEAEEEAPRTDEAIAETKGSAAVKEPEEKLEAAVESAKKEDNETEKSKPEETPLADTPEAKLNGNARNGDKATTATDEKPHRNGLNGDTLTEKSNGDAKDQASGQNGEAESTVEAETTAESIKVKKVVDSTNTDGAGEPDVVSPVAVAATS